MQRFTYWWATRRKTYFKDNIHHLVSSVIRPPSQSKNRGSNLDGKEIRLVEVMAATLEEEIKGHKDESDSSKSDCHWKRPLKKAKVSGEDLDGRGSSALEVLDVPPLLPLNAHLKGLIELDNDESLTGPHAVNSTIEEVGTSKTPIFKPVEQSSHPSALLEEIHRGKMTVGGKDIGSPPSEGDACPKNPYRRQITRNPEPFQWVGEKVISNFFKKTALYKARQLDEKTSAIKEALTLMEQLRGDAKVIQERATQLSLEKKELERRLQNINAESEQLSILSCEKVEAIDQSMEAAREEFKNFKWKL
ncbi:hypothetical protein E5676_scaffold343G00100 [Cucumis melo var. makuwa]|uniref:Uncharacterized protein n=1 Tax=Cucumis melo var. makuwa TaxID=1194695 RepID=A0A5D3E3J3_CUCMM|nr:hypothetical protein E6C27_scaffold19G002630 [Cucumis melo var. makuwa]TYK30693.1 hypothetical protein E5676_scaffold343G00100 [Cucumis melo var. makuwa]